MIAAAACLLLLLATASLRRIWEVDFWWQYRTGELVATHGIPRVDPWSYVSMGNPWIEMRWLWCDLIYRTVQLAGFQAAVYLKGILVLATFALVVVAARAWKTPAAAAAVLVAAILASTQRFFVRPEMASFLFVAMYLWIISRYRRQGGRIIWFLPVLQALWSNLHTQFLLGPALVGLLVVVELVRIPWIGRGGVEREAAVRSVAMLAVVLGATLGACLLTPFGTHGVSYGLGLLGEIHDPVFKDLSDELKGTFIFDASYTAVTWFKVLLGICALSALANLRRLDPFWTILSLSQLYLAWTSIRNMPLFCLAAVPFVISNFAALRLPRARAVRWLVPTVRRLVLVAVIVLSVFFIRGFVTDRFNVEQNDTNQFGAGVATHRFPEGAARFLREHPVPGPMFNSMFAGSYLVAQGFEVFIDPRLEVHGGAFLGRYLKMMNDADAWREAVGRYGFKTAVVELSSSFLRYLVDPAEWQLAYFDESAAVFVRVGVPGGPPAIRSRDDFAKAAARIRGTLPAPPAYVAAGFLGRVVSPMPYYRVADLLMREGQFEAAEPFARDALRAYPPAPGPHAILAQILDARSDREGALSEYQAELLVSPASRFARRQAGLLQFRAGRPEAALELIRKSLEDTPSDAALWAVLTKIHADAGRASEALHCAERAAALDPRSAEYAANLGRLQGITGNLDGAIATLAQAIRLAPKDAGLHGDLAAFLFKTGRREEARAEIDRGLALAPADPELLRIRAGIAAGGR